ncbi:MAG TPA: hypothetical protein PLI09_19615 [Candidatus Hydrogenedentes bacterium]|nr:hypothetical protein [Candidatus Hydrogenedentota bacterium]
MRYVLIFALIAAVAITGCTPKAPEPAPKPENLPPPDPTPEEYFNKDLKPILDVLSRQANGGAPLQPAEKDEAVGKVGSAKSRCSATENGRQALVRMKGAIEDLVKKGRDGNMWLVVKGCCQVYSALQPGSDRYVKLEQRAELMLKRPVVKVQGFFNIDGQIYAFLQVTDPGAAKPESCKVREGDEFHGVLKLVRIIGDRQSVEILYIPVNDTWIVEGPRESK